MNNIFMLAALLSATRILQTEEYEKESLFTEMPEMQTSIAFVKPEKSISTTNAQPAREMSLSAKAAWYWPTSSQFRNIYGTTGMYTVEYDVQAWQDLYGFISGNFLIQNGTSSGSGPQYSTNIWFLPIELGLKYFPPIFCRGDRGGIYIAAGAVGSYVHIHDTDPFLRNTTSGSAWGVNTKLGTTFNLPRNWNLEVFTEYTYLAFSPSGGSFINLGGLSVGGGVEYSF